MDERVFKRINVFRGFIRTAGDYKDAVRYHIRKQRLHTRATHSYGVVPLIEGELSVRARHRPNMTVEVRAGYALDGKGRDVIVPAVQLKALNKEDFMLPQTVYLVLRYVEQRTDHKEVAIPGFPKAAGYARISETYTLDWTIAEPDASKEIELCRILVTDRVEAIRNARDPLNPREGEIDLRYVPKAVVKNGSLIDGAQQLMLRYALMEACRSFTHMARTRNVPSALSAATACSAMMVLNEGLALDDKGFAECMSLLASLEQDIVSEVGRNEPDLARRPKFRAFARRASLAGQLLKGFGELGADERRKVLSDVVAGQTDAMSAIHEVIQPPQLWKIARAAVEPNKGIRVLDGTEWDKLKEDSKVPPESIVVEGVEWRLIDRINVLDRKSMRDHSFAIHDAKDWWRSQVTLKYPDQAEIRDEGIGHEGGYAEWDVHNLVPGRPLVIVRRMDYARADYICTVHVDDVVAGDVPCSGQDTRYRWRNWPFYIYGQYVKKRTVRIKQYIDESNRDVNFFRIWCYQPV